MKPSIFIAAFLAGIVPLCAYATPTEIDVMFENDAYFRVDPTQAYGLHGFERTEIRRSGVNIEVIEHEIDELAIVVVPVAIMDFLPQVPVPQAVFVEPIVPDPLELVAPFVQPQAVFVESIVPDPLELVAPFVQPQAVFVESIVPDPLELFAPFVPPQAVFVEPIVPDPVELIAPLAMMPASMSAAPRAAPVIVMFSEFPDARVPEPASLLLFGSGLLILASRRLFRA